MDASTVPITADELRPFPNAELLHFGGRRWQKVSKVVVENRQVSFNEKFTSSRENQNVLKQSHYERENFIAFRVASDTARSIFISLSHVNTIYSSQ